MAVKLAKHLIQRGQDMDLASANAFEADVFGLATVLYEMASLQPMFFDKNKDEIKRLMGKVEQKGFTLVPLNMHWKNGRVKCEIGLAKGKGEHDKRDTIKDREGKREVERAMKDRTR